ncbi:acetyl-CoA decarbonylase/synthase complex subunit alpha/beta [Dethiobacter alkaliphilus]|uniref:acetyl-CoA decarbonylase/synthase complex subunit alpha/beta n=1 Tax=Dethiobacter alkaliphilus TaxID=427926 RepID=UPI002226BADC|nr:acetyl-CoA decarbonylase/synthase complex subunit alpha/beta [Dethiobacter alkaliphilus]MCW3491427.1 acetyl-CoA decarbonylase/synthase complex subunit alpha/beta [Dethiobacter alkaliphilus]
MSTTAFDEIYAGAIEDESKAPKKLFQRAYNGAITATSYAEILLSQAIRKYGPDKEIGYPDTAYYLPVMSSLSGEKVTKLGELPPILNRMRNQIKETLNFENARLYGESTAYAAEIIEVLRYIEGDPHVAPWTGYLTDPILRKFGIQLVDWTIPGQAVIVGKAKTSEAAAKIVQELQAKGMMIFLVNEVIEQLLEQNMKLGVDYIAFPLGNFTQVIHAVNYALRAGMAFGGIAPGLREEHRDYQHRRVRAFVLHLGDIDDVQVAAHFAAIFIGFPVICDTELEEEIPDWYVSHTDYDTIVKYSMELRGIKLKILEIPVPITIGPAFEGETIRKGDMFVEMGGGRTTAFELVSMVGEDEIEDGKITVTGPDFDEIEEGAKLPLGIKVKIYGRKMQEDFESVLERRIHYFINYGEGLWHVAQRDLCWLRVSKDAVAKGFRVKDYGEILIAKFKDEFPAIVDRVEVELFTDADAVEEQIKGARERYAVRDARLRGLTDEAVDELYSCILCQSFAPNHVCVVSPERVGLCGAVSWLDAKASYEIDPNGPNRPIAKEGVLDEEKGMWESVNEYVYTTSNRSVEEVNLYTLMDRPMTSCGCFEAILAIVPEANGLMVTTREHSGDTPSGMTFSSLAGSVGGGVQAPGFMGIGRSYMLSRKFLKADGGLGRIVWMPKELKDFLGDDLRERAEEDGLGADFVDKIADETVGTTAEEILPFLEEKGHPALTMDPLM